MTPNAEEILKAKVVKVENFQSALAVGQWWTADFQLEGDQRFHVRWNETGYLYTPYDEHNRLPELKEIYWKRYKMGFGGRGCGLNTELTLKEATREDYQAYEKILTPTVIETGRWEPYPDYSYVPMLTTAFDIQYAYQIREEMVRKVKMADQNLADALALREATHKYLGRE